MGTLVRAPCAGIVEWAREGTPIGWLAVDEHCALLPVNAPPGQVTWRRPAVLAQVQPQDPLVLVGDDEALLAECLISQQTAAREACARLDAELASRPEPSALAAQLLDGERRDLEARRRALLALCG